MTQPIEMVHVALAERAYDILIGEGLVDAAAIHLAPFLKRKRIAIVTEDNVARLHLAHLRGVLEGAGIQVSSLVLPPGEGTKDWANFQRVVEWLLAERIERDDLVVAFGGGVIGDLVGFCASVTRRGVRFAQIPTTLLAQVDSSVGGKTGINSPHGKNLVGVFAQPVIVLADTAILTTLTKRDFIAGYGEVVKYGLLGDGDFFTWLEANGPALAAGDTGKRITAIRRCCEMKADIVARDETEKGDRALLNLGHTFGHALESATGYSDRLLHGEGVAIGCALAFEVSQRLGLCSQECPSRVREHLRNMKMKTELSDIAGDLPDADALIALMGQDKKVQDGKLRFILARDIGSTFVTGDVDIGVVRNVLSEALSRRL
jgi:3-dehydroquinate synthase